MESWMADQSAKIAVFNTNMASAKIDLGHPETFKPGSCILTEGADESTCR
jgi:hypothetical protein